MENENDRELVALRQCLAQAMGIVDRLLAQREIADSDGSGTEFRRYIGGPLSERGEAEINRRFEAGLTDSQIAIGMGISLAGVSKRRTMWRRTQTK